MKPYRILVQLCIFVLFLWAGFWFGSRIGKAAEADLEPVSYAQPVNNTPVSGMAPETQNKALPTITLPTETQAAIETEIPPTEDTSTPDATPVPQRNILLVGVEDMQAQPVKLQAVWLIIYVPDMPDMMLMPIYPSAVQDGRGLTISANPTFAEQFSLDDAGFPSQAFQKKLKENGLWWSNILVIDQTALKAVDLLSSRQKQAPGWISADAIPSVQADPQAALLAHAAFLQQECARLSAFPPGEADLLQILNLQPHHLSTDIPITQALADIHELLSQRGSIACEFPSLGLMH